MGRCMTELVDKLSEENNLSTLEMTELVRYRNQETTSYIFKKALETKERYYGRKIFLRGTVELTNYCKNECYYCGLRRSNKFITRFRLDENEIGRASCRERV